MNWFVIVVVAISLLSHQYFSGMVILIAYWLWRLVTKSSRQDEQKGEQEYTHRSQNTDHLSSGNLADLVLLRLELQTLIKLGVINNERQSELNQQIDILCTRYLADIGAFSRNVLWQNHRDNAWDLLNQYADTPLGLPPWRITQHPETESIDTTLSDFSEPITQAANELQTVNDNDHYDKFRRPITSSLNESQTSSFATETATDLNNNTQPCEQTTSFTISEIPIPDAPLANEIQAADFSISNKTAADFSVPEVAIHSPLANELKQSQPASLIVETDFSTPINPFAAELTSNTDTVANEQTATFTIDETDHASIPSQPIQAKANKTDSTLNQYAWKPHEPGRLERVLKTVSGWHSMAVPFLAQNIGWFVGVFCFIAGSIFLVQRTIGYTSNLIAFFSFFIFTIALLFGGYQLRQKRPELEVSSYVIFILGLLLIPLTNITGTQLLLTSDDSVLKLLFSGLLVLTELSVFYFAVTLVSGLMDRSLQQGLPRFFLVLTATQLLQILLSGFPFWQLLLVIHLLIFALLSLGIYLFANQWLQSIFIDQHKIAYFAAGTLVYAAVVSFVFITAGNSIVLPAGYYGFFLLLLCTLLFFIDAQLKDWTERYAYLSRFSFLVYGLSVLALCLVAQHTFAIPTLILAIALYAFMVWRYLTLTPLTILLACYFWLYGSLVLQHLPDSWHFLASLPVLLSLYKTAHWALNKRQSAYLAVIIYRVLYSLLAMLTIWSLYQSEAGLPAMATAITASILIYYTLKAAPVAIFTDYSKIVSAEEDVMCAVSKKYNLLSSHWFYSIPALGAVTIYYTPRLPLLAEQAQFSSGLLMLSIYWAYRGLTAFFKASSTSETTPIEQRLNSALLCLLVGVSPLWMLTDNIQRVAPLFLAAIIMLWLSYQLLTRWLFYLALLACALAYLPLKVIYFPTPSGLDTMLMGISLWFWLWYIERQEASDLTALKREQVTQKIELLPSCQLLGWYRLPNSATLFRDVIDAPLEQVMCLLWLLGMKTLYERFFDNQLSYAWLAAVFLVGLFSLLLIIRYSLIKLLPVPIVLVLAAVLMMLKFWQFDTHDLLLASVLFSLVVWHSVNTALPRPFFITLAETLNPALPNEIEQIGQVTHYTAFFIVLAGVISQLLSFDIHSPIMLLTLLTTVVFLWLSNRTYPHDTVRYLVLGFSVLAAIELVSLTLHPFTWQTLTTDAYAALLCVSLSLAVAGLTIPTTSYEKPSTSTAVLLAFFGVFLQLLHSVQITAIIVPLDYSVLFLAGFSLLLANAKRQSTFYTTAAFMIIVLAILWLEHSIFHAQQPFSLWLNAPIADVWLVLGLLSLAITVLSQWLKSVKNMDVFYFPPLNTVATLCFVWSLLGTLTLFFASAGHADLLTSILLVLLLALFPLSKNRSGAAHSRGFGSACLSTLATFSLLPVGLDSFVLQSVTVLFGYTLWLCASFALPQFNKRYSNWTIEPLFFPYLGFLLVAFSGCWWQTTNDFSLGIYCLELTIYCVLMLRYSRAMIFAWLASFAVVGAVLWLENSFVHSSHALNLWLGTETFFDSWLTLGLLSLTLSMLSHKLKPTQVWAEVYCLPLSSVATLCFAGSLLGTLTLFFISSGQANGLAILLLVSLLTLFSLAKDSADAAKIRGFATANLSALITFSLLPVGLDAFALQSATALYGYILWLFATLVLPRFNQRYSAWMIAPSIFPWLGFLLVALSVAWWQKPGAVDMGIYCLELSAYCLLMLRYSNWREFSWLSAFAFTATGVFFFNIGNDFLAFKLLLWSNLQLLIATFWQRKGEKLAERWQWQSPPLAQAFTNTAQFIFVGYLLIVSIGIGNLLVDSVDKPLGTSVDLLIFILINLSFLHLLWIRFSSFSLHGFIYSLFLSLWVIYFSYLNTLFQPALLIALWSVILFVIRKIPLAYHTNEINNTLNNWLRGSVIVATLSLLTYNEQTLGQLLLSLAMVAGLSAALAGKSMRSPWLMMARIEFLLLLHAWPLLLVGYAMPSLLLPWYALQSTLLAALSIGFLKRLLAKPLNAEDEQYYTQALQGTSWLIALGLFELGWHGVLIQQTIMAGASPNWLLYPFDACAALGTGLIISIIGLRHVRHFPNSKWLYGIIMLIGALAFYGRLLWLGAASVSLWDTAAIIGFAYILFFIQGLFPSKPLYNTALLMPMLALFTAPPQLASPESSVTLMATALLYAIVRRHTQQKIPLYMALLAFNAGVYLWIPNLVERSQLIQVYVIPAALSSLMLLHLHSRELKPSVLMGSRLAAVSSIYACATADVFLRAESQQLGVFILAMVLSMAGIALGIALRTRAFLYAGVSFLLLNVIGQSLHFYPEKGLGKAIVLMVMGATITGFMIWFNIKRTEILQRINAIQAEMQTWE